MQTPMTKFQKFQLYFSVVPGISSALVFLVTMFELRRKRATTKEWLKFMAIFFGFSILASVIDSFVMTGQNPALNLIVFTLIMAMANYLCIKLQMSCESMTDEQEETYKKVNKIGWIAGGILAFIGIISAVIILAINSGPEHIEDNNGIEDTSLAVITIDEFVSTNDHYTALLSGFSEKGDQTDVFGTLDEVDYSRCSWSSKKISGIRTLQATQTDANSMTLTIESTLNSGNMEIIIVIDGEYYQHVTINSKQTIVLEDIAGKLVLVKMAAESAEMRTVVERVID